MKEKSFVLGNANMLHLFEDGDGFEEVVHIPAYLPKDPRVFVSKQTEDSIVVSLPFEVTDLAETIYAGIYEFTQGTNLMSLHIIEDSTGEEVAVSTQGKHLSSIRLAVLPQGLYYLVVKNDRVGGMGGERQAPLEFMLDVIRHQVAVEGKYTDHFMEAMQLCTVPQSPPEGLSKPGYIHPLSGNAMNDILKIGILELDSGSMTTFTLEEDSQVTVYVETSEDIPVALEITETGGIRKAVGLSADQDSFQSNFLKQEGFKEKNVVQLREFLRAGSYWIGVRAVNEDRNMNFDQREFFCETFTLAVTVSPLKTATEFFSPDPEEEFCENLTPLGNQLQVGQISTGFIFRELTAYGAEVGYFDLESDNKEGPFIVYFQLDYDMA